MISSPCPGCSTFNQLPTNGLRKQWKKTQVFGSFIQNTWILASAWLGPSCCGHLRHEPSTGRLLSVSSSLSETQTFKSTTTIIIIIKMALGTPTTNFRNSKFVSHLQFRFGFWLPANGPQGRSRWWLSTWLLAPHMADPEWVSDSYWPLVRHYPGCCRVGSLTCSLSLTCTLSLSLCH